MNINSISCRPFDTTGLKLLCMCLLDRLKHITFTPFVTFLGRSSYEGLKS